MAKSAPPRGGLIWQAGKGLRPVDPLRTGGNQMGEDSYEYRERNNRVLENGNVGRTSIQ